MTRPEMWSIHEHDQRYRTEVIRLLREILNRLPEPNPYFGQGVLDLLITPPVEDDSPNRIPPERPKRRRRKEAGGEG